MSPTSPRYRWSPNTPSASRRSCAGTIRSADWCHRSTSSRWRRRCGLIVPIGAWVLAQVCRDAMRWRKSLPGGRPLMVAVNVSPRQFESGLAETFGNIIEPRASIPATVCLEVTESMVMQDAEMRDHDAARAQVARTQHLGRRFRHRLLVARVPQTLSARRAEDRQVVRRRARTRSRGNRDRRSGDGHGPRTRSARGCGGRRDGGSSGHGFAPSAATRRRASSMRAPGTADDIDARLRTRDAESHRRIRPHRR